MSRQDSVAPETFWRRWRLPFFLSLAAVPLLLAGGRVMFGTLMAYDDEGYVLWTLRNFAEYGKLYREVYTQYGPLPYAVYWLLNSAGMPIDHFTGRTITLLLWLGTAFILALAVGRQTRSLGWSLLTLSLLFFHLWLSVREPTHPGSVVAWFVALAGAAGFYFLTQGRTVAWATTAGLCIAALLLTKINTGVFAGLAFVVMAIAYAAHPTLRRSALWVLAIGLVPLPFLLMRPRLTAPWVLTLAILFALNALGLLVATAQSARLASSPRCTWREIGRATFAALATAAAVLLLVMPRGTSLAELLEGTLFGPLRHPMFFEAPMPWAPLVIASAAVSALVCLAAWRGSASARSKVDGVVVAVRLILLAVVVLGPLTTTVVDRHYAIFWWVMPWLWAWVWPLAGEVPFASAARAWLAFLALGQWLHAYPVPGTQMSWSSFLALPLATLGAWEALNWLKPRLPAGLRSHALGLSLRGVLLATAGIAILPLVRQGDGYSHDRQLNLPGSELIRLPDAVTARTRILSINAAAHAGSLFSLPGMFNFNLWSGRPTPTLANTTQWFLLLSAQQQQSISNVLASDPRACVIVEVGHVGFLSAQNLGPSGPLYDLIQRDFTTAFSLGAYEFRVRRGRRIAAYFLGEILTRPTAPGEAMPSEVMLQLPILLPPGESIARLEIADTNKPGIAPLVLDRNTARFESAPISAQGDLLAPPRAVSPPFAPEGPTQLSIYFDRKGTSFSEGGTLLIFRRADGSELALARLRP